MRRAWIRKVKGSRLVNAEVALSCDESDSPLCFCHSLPRLVLRLQIGWLSLTNRLFKARVSACSIEDRVARTRTSVSEIRPCKFKIVSRTDSADSRVRARESRTLCTFCKTRGGFAGCFADCSVVCQVLLNCS